MESQTPPNTSREEGTTAMSEGSAEIKEALQCLYREIQDLLMTSSMLIYKQYMLRYQALVQKTKSPNLYTDAAKTDWSLCTNEARFSEVIQALRTSGTSSKSRIIRQRLTGIRDSQRCQEQLDLLSKLKALRIECNKLRKVSVSRAKEALTPLMTPKMLACRDLIIEEAEMIEKAETLRMRYETLRAVLDSLQTFYRKVVEPV
ncbi:hypothetical protein X943_003991 [Babesia divergens]|uniref:Uncharacterized protein n=1 Tax=Babesia divergens TaxID=32595 RepID=A0AAD9LIQ2_BABDI|nr:hypothetical protein X943_003991 [Babesia divergens]